MADYLDIRPEPMDSDQKLLRKILAAINLWQGGIVPGQSQNIVIDSSAGAGQVTVVPAAGGATSGDRVGGYTYLGYMQPTVSLAAYADGDAIGTGGNLVAFWRKGVGTGILQSIQVRSRVSIASDIDVVIFRARPITSTLTDNAAITLTDADASAIQGIVTIPSDNWKALGTAHYGATVSNLVLAMANSSPTSEFGYLMYVVLIARGAVTFTATDDLGLWFGVLQD